MTPSEREAAEGRLREVSALVGDVSSVMKKWLAVIDSYRAELTALRARDGEVARELEKRAHALNDVSGGGLTMSIEDTCNLHSAALESAARLRAASAPAGERGT